MWRYTPTPTGKGKSLNKFRGSALPSATDEIQVHVGCEKINHSNIEHVWRLIGSGMWSAEPAEGTVCEV